jgi:peptide/nickel transport system substrate-binding protein
MCCAAGGAVSTALVAIGARQERQMVMTGPFFKNLCAALLMVGFVGAQPARSAEITIALGSEPTTLDPQLVDDGSERAVNDNIYETLMARTPKGELVPGLAESAPTRSGEDAWRFRLRPGIKFTNGEPFDADAVVYSVKRIIDPKYNSQQISYFATITDARKVDDLTVDVITKGPDPILPARMYWMKMVPPVAAARPDFIQSPVGTGPYRLVKWARGASIQLAKNDAYWGGAPSIDTVNYRFIGESGTRLAGLMAGEFDIITNLLPEFMERAPKAEVILGLEQPIMILSAVSGVTKDERVRQALNYAIDKDGLADGLFGTHASVSQGQLLAPSYFGFDKDTKAYPYDLAKAKALIKEAGVQGKTITLTGTAGRWLKDREIIEAVAQMWTEAGLKVDVKIFEFNEYLKRLFDRNIRPDAVFVSNSNELMDADRPLSAYYSMSGPAASNSDAEMKADIDTARTETDPAKRATLYHKIVSHARDKAYFAWLVVLSDLYGTSSRLVWAPRTDAKLLVKEMTIKK